MTTARMLVPELRAIVGDGGLIDDEAVMQPYLVSWRDNWVGRSPAIVRPRSTAQVAAIVTLCARHGVPIVPQGGRTGVTGASQPHDDGSEIVLSTERLNRIRAVDTENDSITVEAGCVLGDVRRAAERVDRVFPLHFGSVDSCQIGGNISTNAGGINVIRYGNTRRLVAGLEVVLPDGQVWDGLRALRKDNAGYDLKQLFIGAEGTLGIITAAVVWLSPAQAGSTTALLATSSPAAALRSLARLRARFPEQVSAAELIERSCLDAAIRHIPGVSDPLSSRHPWHLLVEVSGQETQAAQQAGIEQVFEAGVEAGELLDGVVASSSQQAAALWRMREAIPEAHKQEGISYKHDVSVPVSKVAEFLTRAEAELERWFPGMRMFSFGHLGDGNIHFNPLRGQADAPGLSLAAVNHIVHDLVVGLGGSISAEHGVGRLRREELMRYKSATELAMMATLKRAFDPADIMNPGKVVPAAAMAAWGAS